MFFYRNFIIRYWENVGGAINATDEMWRTADAVGGKFQGGYVAWRDVGQCFLLLNYFSQLHNNLFYRYEQPLFRCVRRKNGATFAKHTFPRKNLPVTTIIGSSWDLSSARLHDRSRAPYIWNAGARKFLGFENQESLREKAKYAIEKYVLCYASHIIIITTLQQNTGQHDK